MFGDLFGFGFGCVLLTLVCLLGFSGVLRWCTLVQMTCVLSIFDLIVLMWVLVDC